MNAIIYFALVNETWLATFEITEFNAAILMFQQTNNNYN